MLKPYDIRFFEIAVLCEVCSRIESLMEGYTSTFELYIARADELLDWEQRCFEEHRIKLQSLKTAQTAIMKLMGA